MLRLGIWSQGDSFFLDRSKGGMDIRVVLGRGWAGGAKDA